MILQFDGGARPTNPGPAACAWILTDGENRWASSRRLGVMTNNEAEYWGLNLGLDAAVALGATHLEVRSDSRLIVEQMQMNWAVKAHNLASLWARAQINVASLEVSGTVEFTWVPREQNGECDAQCTKLLS